MFWRGRHGITPYEQRFILDIYLIFLDIVYRYPADAHFHQLDEPLSRVVPHL